MESVPEGNPANRTLCLGNNLDFLRGMDSGSVDLVATDPPFNRGVDPQGARNTKAETASFQDSWCWDRDIDPQWLESIQITNPALRQAVETAKHSYGHDMAAYLCYIGIRIIEMHRILKDTGTLSLHCNQTASHYLKIVLDTVFGSRNFTTEIIWKSSTPSGGRTTAKKPVKIHDVLLVYAKSYRKNTYNQHFTPYSEKYLRWFRFEDSDGRTYRERLRGEETVKQYLDESPGVPLSTIWDDIPSLTAAQPRKRSKTRKRENRGYPTQKPLALYERIIQTLSNPDDLVLDPFCGSGTTLIAAERSDRKWIGMDELAICRDLLVERLRDLHTHEKVICLNSQGGGA